MKKINFAKITHNFLNCLILILSLTTIFGAIVYYFYALNVVGLILTALLTITSFSVILWRFRGQRQNKAEKEERDKEERDKEERDKEERDKEERDKEYQGKNLAGKNLEKIIPWLNLSAYFLSYGGLLGLLFKAQSERAFISPWLNMPGAFFWLYGLASLFLILNLIHRNLSANKKIVLLTLHYFLSFSVALIVYKIGYGFDPFVHQATMELIAEKGVVLPKTPYYLGQYGLLIMIHKLSGLSLGLLNKLLVPALAALLLPSTFYRFLKNNDEKENDKKIKGKNNIFLVVLFLLILSFPIFIVTTPQNLSYLFLSLAILAGLTPRNYFWVPLLALATAAVHPLTGLPALGWAGWILFKKYQGRLKVSGKKLLKILIFSFTALALPLVLFLGGGGNILENKGWSWLAVALRELWTTPSAAGNENIFLNFTYFFFYNYKIFLILALGAALVYFYRQLKQRAPEENRDEKEKIELKKGLLGLSSALFIAYLLSGRLRFNNLIDYEQTNYAGRILIIIIIFLLPFLVSGLYNLIAAISRKEKATRIIWLIFGLGLLSTSLYISYPRFDKYFNSRGYSTSANDLVAVQEVAIEAEKNIDKPGRDDDNNRNANGSLYLVLANQQVSAAALSIFGFNHYYQTPSGQIYFYPIPTGGPLYQYYLDMVYKKPDQTTALKAMDLVGVDNAYLIVNKYWYQSGRIINEAKLTADKWWDVNGEIYIFKYIR